MSLSLRCFAAASEAGYHLLPHQEGREDKDATEDLDGHKPVPHEPVAEERGEDGLHSQNDRGPRRRNMLLHRGLRQVSPRPQCKAGIALEMMGRPSLGPLESSQAREDRVFPTHVVLLRGTGPDGGRRSTPSQSPILKRYVRLKTPEG